MHIHILGICGTFMGGIAMIARQAGFKVTGADQNVYPPMSEELQKAGIEIYQGYDAKQLDLRPDLIVVGNVMRRGMPVIERMLNENFPYVSGPGWLEEHYLKQKCVLAVAGTHGKTTTSAMLTWILDVCGKNPGFLIGGIPGNYGISARNTDSPYFVIEADEYDCAFFDKRSKFVHYHPQALIINNIEYDHADIFDSVRDIERQFHHFVRTIPSKGLVVAPRADKNVRDALAMGCWTPVVTTGLSDADWSYKMLREDGTEFCILHKGAERAHVNFACTGEYNVKNALNAVVAAGYCGIDPEAAAAALSSFVLPKRRMELKGEACGVSVYDDFAHHPTAILATLAALRGKVGGTARIIAVLEPRSNTMKMGICKDDLAPSLGRADEVFLLQPAHIPWQVAEVAEACVQPAHWSGDVDTLADMVVKTAQPGDHILVMSNGGFGGIHQKLLDGLAKKAEAAQ